MAESIPPPNGSGLLAGRRRVEFVADLYIPEVHAGVLDYARQAGWALFDSKCYLPTTLFTYDEPSDGILVISGTPELEAWVCRRPTPVVRLVSSQSPGAPSVEPDYRAIGVRAAEHLLTLGSPNLAFYRHGKIPDNEKIWTGFSGRLSESGRVAHLLDFMAAVGDWRATGEPQRQVRWRWLSEQLAALPRPLALLVEDDRFANDAMEAALLLGWRIPDDLAVLGVDDRALIRAKLPVPLSSVDSDLRGVGWTGAALLDRILDGEKPPAAPILIQPKQVVSRRSTATFVCDRPEVSVAVNYLRAHFQEGVRIEDLARNAGVSTRSLQVTFKEIVGCTISDELARLRLEHAARLLRETDLKLESVALESGLRNAKYLCEVFRPVFGTTPTAYREAERGGSTKTSSTSRSEHRQQRPAGSRSSS